MPPPGHRRTWLSRTVIRIMQTETAHRVVSWLLARYMRLVVATTRWTLDGIEEGREAFLDTGRNVVVLLWHNRVAMLPFGWRWRDRRLTVLISDHRDGRLITGVLDAAGVGYIRVPANALGQRERGHDTRLKAASVLAIRRAAARGETIGIVGDGPTGPRFILKAFPLDIARLCGAEITLVAYAVRRRIVFRSWDRLIIPLPFNRGVFRWGSRTYDPRDCDGDGLEVLRQHIERDLRTFTDETDRMMGHPPLD